MNLLAAPSLVGFEVGQVIYTAAAFISFAVAGQMFWKRRRLVGRHAAAALALALLIGLFQLLFIVLLSRVRTPDFEQRFLHDAIYVSAVVTLPALFISGFVMAASGAWLSERAETEPFPLSRIATREPAKAAGPALERLTIALVTAGVSIAMTYAVFKGCQIVTGKPPQPAPGLEDLMKIFASDVRIVLSFGLVQAIWEEIFVRIFLLNAFRLMFRRAQGGTAIAVVLSSAIWASGHAGEVSPELVKFLQVFPIGLLFSFVYLRRGAEASIACHCTFNVAIVILGGIK